MRRKLYWFSVATIVLGLITFATGSFSRYFLAKLSPGLAAVVKRTGYWLEYGRDDWLLEFDYGEATDFSKDPWGNEWIRTKAGEIWSVGPNCDFECGLGDDIFVAECETGFSRSDRLIMNANRYTRLVGICVSTLGVIGVLLSRPQLQYDRENGDSQ